MSTWDRSPNAPGRAISPSLTLPPCPPAQGLPGPMTVCREKRLGLMSCLLVSLCAHGLPHPSQLPPVPTGPAQSGILVDREVVSLFLHFTVNPKPRVDFIDRPRCCLRGKECSINRFQQVESRWGYSGTSDRIRWAGQVSWAGQVVGRGLVGASPWGGAGPGWWRSLSISFLRCPQVLGQQTHLCGRLRALRLYPWAHRLPSEHPGPAPTSGPCPSRSPLPLLAPSSHPTPLPLVKGEPRTMPLYPHHWPPPFRLA